MLKNLFNNIVYAEIGCEYILGNTSLEDIFQEKRINNCLLRKAFSCYIIYLFSVLSNPTLFINFMFGIFCYKNVDYENIECTHIRLPIQGLYIVHGERSTGTVYTVSPF